jgi:glycosyltransferase involved in cell wall biosynthesis
MTTVRINIFYVAEFVTGGSVECLHSLITGLDKSRFNPTVLFYHEPAPLIRARFQEAGAMVIILYPGTMEEESAGPTPKLGLQVRIRKLFGRHVEGIYASLKYLYVFLRYKLPISRALKREFSNRNIDIVHLNNGLATDTPGILAAARCKLPVICHVRAFSTHTRLHLWAARYVAVFLCVSNAVRDHMVEAGVDASQTVVCHDSVNQQRFRKTSVDRDSLLTEFGWSDANKVFGVIGRLDLWKGHPYFVEAINIARRTDPDIRGLIVGDTTPSKKNRAYVEGLGEQIDALELQSSVAFSGYRTDIPEIIQCLDAVVCSSSKPEPFGLMVVESMAVGTPVIATKAGGPVDMISDGEDGFLVPLKDSAAIAEAMLRIAGDSRLAEEISAAGERTVAARFTVAHHVSNVCNAYELALKADQARKT